MYNLLSWQKECIQLWEQNNHRGVVEVVTGAGKTIMAIEAMKNLSIMLCGNLKTYIIVPKIAILDQWKASLLKQGIEEASIGSYRVQLLEHKKVILYVVNSARYRLARMVLEDMRKGVNVMLIADEYHHYSSSENSKIFDFFYDPGFKSDMYFSLGLTATKLAQKEKQDTIQKYLGNLIYTYGIEKAVKQEIVNRFIIMNVSTQLNSMLRQEYEEMTEKIANINRYLSRKYVFISSEKLDFPTYVAQLRRYAAKTDYDVIDILLNLYYTRRQLLFGNPSRLGAAKDILLNLDENSKVIVFTQTIETSDYLYHELVDRFGFQVAHYNSKMGKEVREKALYEYRTGQARIMLCCNALDEGFDVPSADVGIVISSTNSRRQRLQRLGRVIRRAEGKLPSTIYYIYTEDTSEAPRLLLENIDYAREVFLEYDEGGRINCHEYQRLCERYISSIRHLATVDQLSAIEKLLMRGSCRSEWLFSEKDFNLVLSTDMSRGKRNYYLLMRKISSMVPSTI